MAVRLTQLRPCEKLVALTPLSSPDSLGEANKTVVLRFSAVKRTSFRRHIRGGVEASELGGGHRMSLTIGAVCSDTPPGACLNIHKVIFTQRPLPALWDCRGHSAYAYTNLEWVEGETENTNLV